MNPALVGVLLLGLVAASTVLGIAWRASQGKARAVNATTVVSAADLPGADRLGSGATLLQFSTEVCSPCRATHAVLDGIATELNTVTHVDLDVTHRPDLAARYRIMQTPTTLILDHTGTVRARIGGAARRDTVRAELDRILTTRSTAA